MRTGDYSSALSWSVAGYRRTNGECGGMRNAVIVTLAINVGPLKKLLNDIGRAVVKKRRNTKSQSRVSIPRQVMASE